MVLETCSRSAAQWFATTAFRHWLVPSCGKAVASSRYVKGSVWAGATILGTYGLYRAACWYRECVPVSTEDLIESDAKHGEEAVLDIEDCLEEDEVGQPAKIVVGRESDLVGASIVALKLKFGAASGYRPEDSPAVRRAAFEWIQRRLRKEHPSLRDCDVRQVAYRAVPQLWVRDKFEVYSSQVNRSWTKAARDGSLWVPLRLVAALLLGRDPVVPPRM
jgi:hypothetical protein